MKTTNKTKNMKNQKLTREMEVVISAREAYNMTLDNNFQKSMEIIAKHSVLTQYLKLSSIIVGWFDDMISSGVALEQLKQNFDNDTMKNLELYINTGNTRGLSKINLQLKETINGFFKK